MRVYVDYDVLAFYKRIVETNSRADLETFSKLTRFEKNRILNEVFMQVFAKYLKTVRINGNEVGGSTEINESEVTFKRRGDFKLVLKCQYFADEEIFNVDILKYELCNNNLESLVNTALSVAMEKIESQFLEDDFLREFFNVLHHKKLTDADASVAFTMRKIYENSMKYFPNFAKLTYDERIEVLQSGYYGGRKAETHDIHKFAKATFKAFADFRNAFLLEVIIKYDANLQKRKKHYLKYINRRTRKHPENKKEIWEKGCVIWIQYEVPYSKKGNGSYMTGVAAQDIWAILAINRDSDMENVA